MLAGRALLTRAPAPPTGAALAPTLRRWWARSSSLSAPRAMATPATADDVAVVYVTAPSADVARRIAGELVASRAAACVNIVPGVTSVYRWKGAVEADDEVLMLVKARRGELAALTAAVKALHPYDEPEVLAVPAVGGSETYMKWVLESTDKNASG